MPLPPKSSRFPDSTNHFGPAGFTVLEFLGLVLIVGILAAIIGISFPGRARTSRAKVATSQMETLAKALDSYRVDVGYYPPDDQGLKALINPPESGYLWQGPYIHNRLPLDPWGRPFFYRSIDNASSFELFSYGRDGVPGGERENGDISFAR